VRLRDYIVTREGWIFAVADYWHPGGVRCILRYIPDPRGDRIKNRARFRKLDFKEAYRFLHEHRPQWVGDVHTVPFNSVERVFSPPGGLARALRENPKIGVIVEALKGISRAKMGVTGSQLLGLASPSSDIDFVVYGEAWFQAREALNRIKREGGRITEVSPDMWKHIYRKRSPELSFEEFLVHEMRKGNRGMVDDTYFDLLYVRDWKEIKQPPMPRGRDQGRMRLTAVVLNADHAFDSPAIYQIDHPEVKEVLSYTHTYAGQVLAGETLEAQGVLEETSRGKRLVVGTTREARGEWIKSLSLLGEERK